LIFMW